MSAMRWKAGCSKLRIITYPVEFPSFFVKALQNERPLHRVSRGFSRTQNIGTHE